MYFNVVKNVFKFDKNNVTKNMRLRLDSRL